MKKTMLIDTTHPEEIRVAVLAENGRLEEFDFETSTRQNLKGNIYLAKVIRIEPALQAAFVEYGGDRHGFLAFDDIHPDYFRIPIAERAEIETAEDKVELLLDEVEEEGFVPRRLQIYKNYKIQEVLKRGQIMLVQVVKEERGNKGAALTTYLSLAGRYCVLMPNAGHGCGGVSRKIHDVKDRKRLRAIIDALDIPSTMGLIVRTAGMDRTKLEIRRDADYLLRLWGEIRDLTMTSVAPSLIYGESGLIKRAIRDVYSKDVDKVLVEGEEGYKEAKNFIKMLMPSHAKKMQQHKDPLLPLFQAYKVEDQIDEMYSPVVPLKSGGYLIINPTEALVSIDVNSGKATKERHIEETAVKTNLEAADEVARVLRLRDLAGIIVIDFIDMEDEKNIHLVERRFRDAIKIDRARIQVGRISMFGLLELSRQRLRPGILEASTQKCLHCDGLGVVRSVESSTLQALRTIEGEALKGQLQEMTVTLPPSVCLYLINQKRASLLSIEQRFNVKVWLRTDDALNPPNMRIDTDRKKEPTKPERFKKPTINKPIEAPEMTPEIEPIAEPIAVKHRHTTQKHVAVPVKLIKEDVEPHEDSLELDLDQPKKLSRSARRRKNRLEKQRSGVLTVQEPVAEDVPELVVVELTETLQAKENLGAKRSRSRNRRKPNVTVTELVLDAPEIIAEVAEKVESVPVLEAKKRPLRRSKKPSADLKDAPKTDESKDQLNAKAPVEAPEKGVSRPLFEGATEEKKLVLTGETFRLGRPFTPVVPPNLRLDISEEILRKELMIDSNIKASGSSAPLDNKVAGLSEDAAKQKKGKAWWQKLLK